MLEERKVDAYVVLKPNKEKMRSHKVRGVNNV